MFIFRHSRREMADQIPRDTEENKQNEIQYKVCITWDRWNQPFLIYSFPSNSSLTIFIGKQDQEYSHYIYNWLLLNEHIFDLLIVLHRVEISYSRTDTSPDADERPMFGHICPGPWNSKIFIVPAPTVTRKLIILRS